MNRFVPVLLLVILITASVRGDLAVLPSDRAGQVLDDASNVIAEDSLPRPSMRISASAEQGVRDDDTIDGSAAAFLANDRNWVIQWHWDESHLMPGIEYDAYARIKVQKDSQGPSTIQGGVYDDARRANPISPSSIDLAKIEKDRWFLIHYGMIRPGQQQFIWLAGDSAQSGQASRILFDRFILVPRLKGENIRNILDARRPDSPLAGFSIDAAQHGRLVLEFDGAPDLTLDIYTSLGDRGRAQVTASPWREGAFSQSQPISDWQAGASARQVECRLGTFFPGAERTQLVIEVVAASSRAVLFGAIASPRRADLPIRAIWSDPPMGAAGNDLILIDQQTRDTSFVAQFDAILRDLQKLLPSAPVAARIESATRKVYRTPGTAQPRRDWIDGRAAHTANIVAAGNEYESFQIVLIPLGGREINGITASPGEWDGPGSLPPLRINPVGYVEAEPLGYPVERNGWTPDPLMPNGPVKLPGDGFQPLWCTAFVPKNTPPGRYKTEVSISIPQEGQEPTVLTIPVELEVWDFSLTDVTHLRTHFWFNRGYLNLFYGVQEGDVDWEVAKQWFGFHLDHRITPSDDVFVRGAEPYIRTYREPDGSITFDFTDQDRLLSYLLDERKATSHGIGPNHNAAEWYDRWPAIDRATGEKIILTSGNRDAQGNSQGPLRVDEQYQSFMRHYLSTYWAHLQKKGWADRAFHQMFDEPRHASDELIKLVQISHEAAPGCPVLTTVPWGFFPDGVIGIHVPLTNTFDPATAPQRRSKGEETWWYVCSTPKHPHANFFLEYPAEDARILPWLSWKYGAQGILYWGTNEWAGKPFCENVGHADPDDRWPNRPWKANPYRMINGEGYLLYPGPDMQPLASIRLVNLREGIEDYEYLWTLSNLLKQLETVAPGRSDAAGSELVARAHRLLQVDPAVAVSRTEFAHSPEAFAKARNDLAECIVQIRHVLENPTND